MNNFPDVTFSPEYHKRIVDKYIDKIKALQQQLSEANELIASHEKLNVLHSKRNADLKAELAKHESLGTEVKMLKDLMFHYEHGLRHVSLSGRRNNETISAGYAHLSLREAEEIKKNINPPQSENGGSDAIH